MTVNLEFLLVFLGGIGQPRALDPEEGERQARGCRHTPGFEQAYDGSVSVLGHLPIFDGHVCGVDLKETRGRRGERNPYHRLVRPSVVLLDNLGGFELAARPVRSNSISFLLCSGFSPILESFPDLIRYGLILFSFLLFFPSQS